MQSSMFKPAVKQVVSTVLSVLDERRRLAVKEYFELRFWRGLHAEIGGLGDAEKAARLAHERAHYQYFFTEFFGLALDAYRGRRILDIGCGPMGSLEWADAAAERVGLDPLADQYRRLGAGTHAMDYVAAPSEAIPFGQGHFDFVTTFNSLDHVADVPATIAEMQRVAGPGATVLVITEIDHVPTFTEPHRLSRAVLELFQPAFEIVSARTFGVPPDHNLYAGMRAGLAQPAGQPGVLAARLQRRPA